MKGAERISLTIEGPVEAVREKLQSIEGVLNIQAEDTAENQATYIVECQLGSDLRRVMAETVVSQNWGLLELRGVALSLEDVFINLITKE